MTEFFDLLRYQELRKLDREGKIPFRSDTFMEFLGLQCEISAQISYNRKEVYFSLIKQYLNNFITMDEFCNTYSDMIKQDSRIAYETLQDFQKLEAFPLSKDRHKFSDPIIEISLLCTEYSVDYMSTSDFYSLVKRAFSKLPKNLFN